MIKHVKNYDFIKSKNVVFCMIKNITALNIELDIACLAWIEVSTL